MQKESYYFSHDANAHFDDKILELRSEYGWEGYGVFWFLIELLRSQSDYTYNLSKISGLSIATAMPKQWLLDYIGYCIKIGLFVENNGEFYSESLMRRMEQIDEKRRKKAESGRLGGIAKALLKQNSGDALANPSKEKKRKEIKEKEKSKEYHHNNFKSNENENIDICGIIQKREDELRKNPPKVLSDEEILQKMIEEKERIELKRKANEFTL